MSIDIVNWKEFVEQFGLNDTYMGMKSARQINIQMRKELEPMTIPPKNYSIRCNTDSEAICLFEFISSNKKYWSYRYTGTAN